MNVLFISAACSAHTVKWVNAIVEYGHDVVLVSERNHKAGVDTISEKVKVVYLPVEGMKGYYLNLFALRKIFKRGHFDVINVHYASGYGTLARMAQLPHTILSVWGSDVYEFPYGSKIKEGILKKNLKYADIIASTSNCMALQIQKYLPNNKDIRITPFGVDISKFSPIKEKKDNRKFVFGVVKTLSENYGISTIIKAFAKFQRLISRTGNSETILEIYGKGEQLNELMELARKEKVDRQVFFRGYIANDKVPDALHGMDVFVCGSKRESFGVSAIEAMACGLPVIATNASGFQEVIENGKTGYLIPIEDMNAMAEQMVKLYQDKILREKMGESGRKRVEMLYSWKANVRTMLELYNEVAKNR